MEPVTGLKKLQGWAKRAWGRQPQQKRWLEEDSKVREVARSTAGFVLGMALASLYGALVLLAQSGNLWYCLVTTISLGTALGLGMAFSIKVRVSVLLTLPHIFTSKQPGSRSGGHGRCWPPAEPQGHLVPTGEGKMLLLLLALGMAVQGPCTNILHNFSRAAESLSCGAELALNQTAERLQRAREPLLSEMGGGLGEQGGALPGVWEEVGSAGRSWAAHNPRGALRALLSAEVLAKIKDIAQKAKVVGDRVRKFFRSIMDSVSHVGAWGLPGCPQPHHPPRAPGPRPHCPLPARSPSPAQRVALAGQRGRAVQPGAGHAVPPLPAPLRGGQGQLRARALLPLLPLLHHHHLQAALWPGQRCVRPPWPLCGEGGTAGQSHNRCLWPHPGKASPFRSWPPLLHHPPVHPVLPQEDDRSP